MSQTLAFPEIPCAGGATVPGVGELMMAGANERTVNMLVYLDENRRHGQSTAGSIEAGSIEARSMESRSMEARSVEVPVQGALHGADELWADD